MLFTCVAQSTRIAVMQVCNYAFSIIVFHNIWKLFKIEIHASDNTLLYCVTVFYIHQYYNAFHLPYDLTYLINGFKLKRTAKLQIGTRNGVWS